MQNRTIRFLSHPFQFNPLRTKIEFRAERAKAHEVHVMNSCEYGILVKHCSKLKNYVPTSVCSNKKITSKFEGKLYRLLTRSIIFNFHSPISRESISNSLSIFSAPPHGVRVGKRHLNVRQNLGADNGPGIIMKWSKRDEGGFQVVIIPSTNQPLFRRGQRNWLISVQMGAEGSAKY